MKYLFIPSFFSILLSYPFQGCEYNSDCPLPQICCQLQCFKICCEMKSLTLKPIYNEKK